MPSELAENPVNINTFLLSTLYGLVDKLSVALFIVFEYIKNLGLLVGSVKGPPFVTKLATLTNPLLEADGLLVKVLLLSLIKLIKFKKFALVGCSKNIQSLVLDIVLLETLKLYVSPFRPASHPASKNIARRVIFIPLVEFPVKLTVPFLLF